MSTTLIFNLPNLAYWLTLALIITIQGWRIGKRGKAPWPEARRWWTGWFTLFGSAVPMVAFYGWDTETVVVLAVITAVFHIIEIERIFIGDLWQRRENHRWTMQYFIGILSTLPFTTNDLDFLTLLLIFASLGVAGLTKVSVESWLESREANKLRRQKRETNNGKTRG